MSSIVRRIAAFGVAALLVGVAAWPAAAREPAQIRINKGSSALQDGNAQIALRARCDANLAAFELDVTVQQGAVIGEVSMVQAGVVTCDGAGIVSTSSWSARPAILERASSGLRVPRRVRPERGGSGGEGLGQRTSVPPRPTQLLVGRLRGCRAVRDGALRFRHHDPERFDDRTTGVLLRGHVHSAQRARTLDLLPRLRILRRRPRGTMGSEGVSHVPIGGRSPSQDHEEQERRSDDREAEHCRCSMPGSIPISRGGITRCSQASRNPGVFTRRLSVIDEQVTVCSRR